jgi:hypothetical protein
MILPFRRHGYLVAVFYVGALILTQLIVDSFKGAGFYTSHSWPKYLGIGMGALLCWIVGKWLNSGKVSRRLRDLDTGQEVVVPPQYHEFPMSKWNTGVSSEQQPALSLLFSPNLT